MSAAVRSTPVSHYRAQFDAVKRTLPGTPASREAAFARFEELGFPAPREEAWKYTNLRRLESRAFVPSHPDRAASIAVPALSSMGLPRLVLVDGYVRDDLSTVPERSRGLRLRRSTRPGIEVVDGDRGVRVMTGGGTERFAALNAALTGDPLVIEVPAGATDAALHVVCVAGDASLSMSNPRLHLRLADGARCKLVLEHTGDEAGERWVNSVVDLELARGSMLDVYRFQHLGSRTFHTERIEANVAGHARLRLRDAALGGTLSRTDINANLMGADACIEATGLFLADSSRHLDTQVRVDHHAAATTSLQEYRGIAAGRGRGVFNTKVVVHPGAQKTNARQSSRNLLLSAGAEIDTKPELEIYADDVQCGHGATTGQLDPNALFYLRSRGIAATEARRVLTRAFAGSVLARMDLDGYAEAVHAALDSRLDALLENVA